MRPTRLNCQTRAGARRYLTGLVETVSGRILRQHLWYCTTVCSTKGTRYFALCCAASKLRLELRGVSPVRATLVSLAALPLRHAQLCSVVLGGLLHPSALAAGIP